MWKVTSEIYPKLASTSLVDWTFIFQKA